MHDTAADWVWLLIACGSFVIGFTLGIAMDGPEVDP